MVEETDSTLQECVTFKQIWEAKSRISSLVMRTPLIKSAFLSNVTGSSVYLKLENWQTTGAFKIRGAANKILSLSPQEQERGVATFSTGNHGIAVAHVAMKLGIQATICISNRVPKAKVDVLRHLGANIEIVGSNQDDAEEYCNYLGDKHGLSVIKPFDDAEIISGQGTIGIELLEDLPDMDRVIIPLSGGGLLSGIGLALKSSDKHINITGVSMEKSAVMYESLKHGAPIVMKEEDTLADSLLGGIGLNNRCTFNMVQKYMDEAFLVPESSIAKGIVCLLEHHKMVVEGAAATGIAALLDGNIPKGEKIVVIVSGNNVDLSVILEAVDKSHCNNQFK